MSAWSDQADAEMVDNAMKCPHCGKGTLIPIKGDEPFTIDHFQCDECDSTYNTEEEANNGRQ